MLLWASAELKTEVSVSPSRAFWPRGSKHTWEEVRAVLANSRLVSILQEGLSGTQSSTALTGPEAPTA